MKCREKAEITVFFALSLTLVFALMLTLLESSRIQAARLYFTTAANASVDSLFSQYHKELWEEYRLLGLEHYDRQQILDEAAGFLDPYLRAKNWFPMSEGKTEIREIILLTEENGRIFEEEVLDYMKYGIAASVWDEILVREYTKTVLEGTGTAEVSGLYRDHAEEAAELENDLQTISQCLAMQESAFHDASECLEEADGDGFADAAEKIIDALEQLPEMIHRYEEHADSLAAALKISEQETAQAAAEGKLSEDAAEMMRQEIREFDTYVSEDGERRKAILKYETRAGENIRLVEALIEEAEEIMEYIEEREYEDEEDEPDDEALWAPLCRRLRQYDLISMDCRYGIQDPETRKKLEDLGSFLRTNLLELVLPADITLSRERLAVSDTPSAEWYLNKDTSSRDAKDRIFLAEYMIRMMNYLGRGNTGGESKQTGSGHLEAEYVLFGKDNDTDNLLSVTESLVSTRTGLNLVFLYKDTARRAQARTLALEVTGALGLTPLVTVMEFFIISIWALAQAVCDVRDLFAGRRVPLLHNDKSFYLTPESLLQMAVGMKKEQETQNGNGLKYADYLRIFLIACIDSEKEFRCMDIMQMCLRKKQPDFRLDRLIRSLELSMEVHTEHVFTSFGLVQEGRTLPSRNYDMHVSTSYSY